MTLTPGRGYPQTGVAAFTTRQRSAVDGGDQATPLDQLTGEQASAAVGDPIPLVFCDRIDGVGGVWVDPPATEARYENDANDTLTVSYQLVISDGELGGLSSVWQGQQLRAGPGAVATPERPLAVVDWSYDGRTGTWQPGNFVTQNWKLSTSTNTQEVTGAAVASEAELEDAKARITLTSKSDYVTRFEFTAVMIDWGSRVPAGISGSASTGEGSSGPSLVSTFVDDTKPLRNLGNWSFSRERSLEPQRIELEHVEDVYWDGEFIPRAAYRGTTVEESIEPSRILEIPEFTGSGRGSYAGLSTLSYTDTYPVGNDTWGQQVHVFIENGVQVPLLLGPGESHSNLLPDLARYLLLRRSVPVDLIDVDALMDAALFNRENGLLFNGVLAIPSNLRDWLHRIAPFYLLRVTNRQGKIGLRPAVPTYGTGEIALDPVTPAFTFTEDHIIPGSFRQELIGVGERRAFTALMQWREQPLDQVGIPRATEVRRADADPDAPVEVFDLTECCVTEDHAVKAAIYQLSRRQHVTHTLTIDVVPDPSVAALDQGDVVRVTYLRMVAGVGSTVHDFFYELEEVTTTDEGAVTLKLSHYPVTDAGESVFALEVARGASLREGFAWQANAAEYGNSLVFAGEGADENLDDVKDPPIPYGARASFSPPFINVGANTILVKVCMDKPAQTQNMNLRLASQLVAFNNQTIQIGIGQQCGEVELPLPAEPGTVGILGYNGGGYVNPDLSDTLTIGESEGLTGLAWVKFDPFLGGFNASELWRTSGGDPIISTSDTLSFRVGSGNGAAWVEATMSLPGINAWRNTVLNAFAPLAVGGTGGGPHPTDPTGKTVWARNVIYDDTRIIALALPCGNGSCIVVVHVRAAGSYAGYGERAVSGVLIGADWFVSGGTTDETISNLTVSASDTAAFVVSQTGCREISVPSTLQSLLATLTPPTTWGNPQTPVLAGDPSARFEELGVTIHTVTPTNAYWYESGETDYRMFDDAIGLPLYTSYGADNLVMEYASPGHMFTPTINTPAIFALLGEYETVLPSLPFVAGLDYEFNYAAGRSTLTALGAPAPTHVVGIDARNSDYQAFSVAMDTDPDYLAGTTGLYVDPDRLLPSLAIVRSDTQPATVYTQLPQAGTWAAVATLPLSPTRVNYGDTPDDAYQLLWHYDWAQPDYCRDQLIALGFTGADLTP